MTYDEKLSEIAHYHGFESQCHQLVEESAELIQALNKLWRAKEENKALGLDYLVHGSAWENAAEEMSDVMICLTQVSMLMCEQNSRMSAYMQKYYGFKIDREYDKVQKRKEFAKTNGEG